MRSVFALGFLHLSLFTGCFASSSTEPLCTAAPVCPPGTMPAECTGLVGCEEVSLCGQTISCTLPVNCGAVPVCLAGEAEDPTCEFRDGDPRCVERSICGATIWCALECDHEALCEDYVPREEICDDAGPPCRQVEACGRIFYCEQAVACEAEPVCPLDMEEVPMCEIADPGCLIQEACGQRIYCVPSFNACSGGRQVSGPAECDEGASCYFEDYGDRRIWCTGGGDNCFAYPVCGPEEEPADLLDECLEGRCRYVTTCGITIQCATVLVDGKA